MGNSNMNPQQNSKNNHSSTVKNCAKSLNENTPVINLQVATSEMEAEENNTSTTKRRKRQTTKRKNNELEMDNVLSSTPRLRTRNDYAKLSKSELNKLADRIQSVIEQVDSEPNTKTINPCANKYKKRKKSDTVRGEQIPGTSFGAGAIGTVSTSFNRYGVSPCVCCNNIDLTCDKHLQGPCNTESRISLGYNGMIKKMSPNTAYRFKKDQERSLHQESKLLLQEESPVLLHQQHLMYMNESTNYEHSSLTQDKLDLIQKFMDSMAADRIDYEKPQQLNIIQGIDPILFDSETKETRLSTHLQDSRTIVQRVNYKKKRSSKISSLPQNKFSFNEVAAMSTPNVKTMRSTSIANIIAVINEVATMSTTNFESVGNEVASTSTSRVEADVNEVANIPTTDFEAVVNEVADTSTSRADVDSDEVTNMLTPDVIALARTSTFRVEADINEVATMSTPNVNEVAGTSTFRAEADINGAATMSTPNVEAVPATSSSSVAADINVVTARPTSNVEFVVIDDVTTKSSRNFRVINEEPLLINDDNLSNQTITYDTELNKENNRTGCLNINLSFVTMRKHPKVKIEVSSSIEQNNHVNSTNVNCSTNQPCATNNTPRLSGMLSSEAEVMDLVDNLLGDDRHNIDHQANRRFEMMMRADVIACNDSNIIDLDVLDDGIHDFMNHDQSVILIEDSDHNDSVQVVENCENRRSKRNKCKNTKTTVQAAETKEENPKVESLEIDTASSNNAISRSCPVCLEYLDSKPVSATTCGHVFCTACITQSIKTNRKCPNCRMGLTLKKIHPLYLN